MRTTIRLNDQLLKETKRLAAQSGRSLTAIIEDALREMLSRQRRPADRPRVHLTNVSGNGLLPGVNLDDSAALLDLMENTDASG